MSVQAMKQAIRQRIIVDRAALPQEVRARLSGEITARLLCLDAYREAHTVLSYMSFGAEFEGNSWTRQVLADGKMLLLPKVNIDTRELKLYRVTDVDAQLAHGAYGIREPLLQDCAAARLEEADFILLPGVAFTRDGGRLGYGGGFYDKLLAQLQDVNQTSRPSLVAAAFAMQVVPNVPLETTDVKVEWLVTEHETIRCAGF